jgi:hypothetical protein
MTWLSPDGKYDNGETPVLELAEPVFRFSGLALITDCPF